MRYLTPALFREGRTDTAFLGPLLIRLLRDLCWGAGHPVELPEAIRELRSLVPAADAPRADRIAAVVAASPGEFDLLFIHADGGGDPARAIAEQITPGRAAIAAAAATHGFVTVPVVPIRETETWALADPAALARVMACAPDTVHAHLPARAAALEGIDDPKAVLERLLTHDLKPRQRRGISKNLRPWLERLGGEVALDRLRSLPAFARLTDDTRAALATLGVMR